MKSLSWVLAALPLIAASPAPDARQADFQVGGVSFSLPLPASYCLPAGKDAAVAKLMAAGDTTNTTDLTLVRCDEGIVPGANDYTYVKTPVAALQITIDRPTLLAQLGAEFGKAIDTTSASSQAGKKLSEVAGMKIDISGSFAPRGKDDVCGYMAGVLHVATDKISYDQPIAVCITSVGGRVLSVYRTGKKNDEAGILALMREARLLALTIKPGKGISL